MRSRDTMGKLICLEDPLSPIAEAYRTLRTNLQFAGVNGELRSLVVTSAVAGEGKTTTVTNLAITMAQGDKKVLLIDGDLRKPSLHDVFPGLSNRLGLTHLLIREAEIEQAVQVIEEVGLHVMTAGSIPPNPSELLDSRRMVEVLNELQARYDMILIDSPPLLPVTDAQVLSRHTEGVLLVLSSGKVQSEYAKKAKMLLDHVGARIVGTVLNNKRVNRSVYSYYDE